MVSITLSVKPEVKALMNQFPEMNWSGFIRKAIQEKTTKLNWKEKMLENRQDQREIEEWAVNLQKKSRKNRYVELKKKGSI